MVKFEEKAKKLVLQKFHKWIHVFGKKSKWEDTNKKAVGPCDRGKREVCTKEGKGISIVKERERRGDRRIIEIRVYLTLEIASNSTSISCRKEE